MQFTNFNIGKRLGITFGGLAVLTIALGSTAYLALSGVSDRWEQFEKVSMRKSRAVSDGAAALGDAIHHFKNYLLRGQDYNKKFNSDMDAIDKAVDSYKAVGAIQEKETQALEQISKGAVAYRAAIKQVTVLKTAATPIEEIDKSIKGADKQIDTAFKELLAITSAETVEAGKQITQQAANGERTIAAMSLLAALLSALSAWLISRSITVPLKEAVRVARTVANGDLSSSITAHSTDETGHLLMALRDMNHSLANIVSNVRSGTETMAAASRQIAAGNLDLSTRTEEQASSLEHTAASMEKLTSTVKENANNAREANRLAVHASDVAARGGVVVSQVVDTMAGINDSSRKIVDIIGVIDAIAFQTNILALNAAVEAARAGDQGRGFAVVASEVRSLAQRSSAAAKEIKTLIDDSVDKVGAGTKLVSDAGATMDDVVLSVKHVTDIIAAISAASDEQSHGIVKIGAAITQMDRMTEQNAALVEEAAAAAASMENQAGNLANTVSVFQLGSSQIRPDNMQAAQRLAPDTTRQNKPALPARSLLLQQGGARLSEA